ncbi:MAG: carboxypeptidase-like regulatory domain-containing protein [Ekhidna sp.]
MKKNTLMMVAVFSVFMLTISTPSSAQLFKTKLQITVIDGLGNVVEGAEVKLFANETDYKSSENVVTSGTTDDKGRVKFKPLETQAYFLDVRKGDLMNDGRAVKTTVLEKGKTTRVNIVIE